MYLIIIECVFLNMLEETFYKLLMHWWPTLDEAIMFKVTSLCWNVAKSNWTFSGSSEQPGDFFFLIHLRAVRAVQMCSMFLSPTVANGMLNPHL